MFVTATARFLVMMVFVIMATTATFLVVVVMMLMIVATAGALAVIMFVMMPATAAFTLVIIVVMMTAAAAFALIVIVMMAAAATTAAFVMMVMMAAPTATAARMGTRQRDGHERFVNHRALQAHAFQHLTESVVRDDAEAVLGLRNADAASDESVDRLLHELVVARDVHHFVFARLNNVEGALFIDENVVHFQRTNLAQRVFTGLFADRENSRRLHAVSVGKNHLLGASQKGMCRTGFQRQKLRDLHRKL